MTVGVANQLRKRRNMYMLYEMNDSKPTNDEKLTFARLLVLILELA